jgi:hypothetical protein
MSDTQNVELLIEDIHKRVAAMDAARMTEESVRALVQGVIDEKLGDAEFVRKMRFGAADPVLIGTKFARWGSSVADIEFLWDLLTGAQARGMSKGPSDELTAAFKAVSDARYLSEDEIKRIDGQAIDNLFPRINKRQIKAYEAAFRAMDTAESGYGSQLIGAQYVGDLWEAARPSSNVFGLINTFEMTAPTAYLPVEVDVPEMLLVSESTANNSSNYSTVKTGSNRVTVTASKFVIHQMWSGEMEEDSIIPFVPFLRMQLAKALGLYSDSLVLNGDTTNAGTGNINLDDADPADTKHYLAFDGIRHAFLVDATGQGTNVAGAITMNTLRDLRGLMVDTTYYHDWGHPNDRNDLVFVADIATGDRIALLDEVVSAKIQSGNSADLLGGQVASILGYPVVTSIMMSKTEADGKVSTTGGNNVKGQVVAFNRRGAVAGWRRRVKLETERLPATDQTRIVASLRMGLGRYTPTGAASGIRWVSGAYNITL